MQDFIKSMVDCISKELLDNTDMRYITSKLARGLTIKSLLQDIEEQNSNLNNAKSLIGNYNYPFIYAYMQRSMSMALLYVEKNTVFYNDLEVDDLEAASWIDGIGNLFDLDAGSFLLDLEKQYTFEAEYYGCYLQSTHEGWQYYRTMVLDSLPEKTMDDLLLHCNNKIINDPNNFVSHTIDDDLPF